MKIFGFEIYDQLLSAFPIFAWVLLGIITLASIKIAFGKELIWLIKVLYGKFIAREKIIKFPDWVAECKTRQGWIQKGDAYAIDLKNKYLKRLSFVVSPLGRPKNWRGGFILGNVSHPQSIIDSNAITIHVGSPPSIAKAQHAWIYDEVNLRNNPASRTVKNLEINEAIFLIEINSKNFMNVSINNQIVYTRRLLSSDFRKKVYLLAWGDFANCSVKFKKIRAVI